MLENLTILTALDTNITTFGFMIIAVSVFWLWWRKPHQRFPSGPRGVPLFGVLPWIGKYPERVLKKWSRKYYGPVMSARFGMEDVVVLNTFEAIQQVTFVFCVGYYSPANSFRRVNQALCVYLTTPGIEQRVMNLSIANPTLITKAIVCSITCS